MRNFLIACQFLTRITINPNLEIGEGDMAKSAKAYPLVGFVIGLLLFLLFMGLNEVLGFPIVTSAIFLVLAEMLLTGGLHLDGLMDCADGLFSYRSKERILAIMKDSHVGANAVLALVSLVLVKIALLITILPEQPWILILLSLVSRWVLVDLAFRYPYAGKPGSLGGSIIEQIGLLEFWVASISTLLATAFTMALGVVFFRQTWLLVSIFAIVTWVFTALVARLVANNAVKKIDGITGDILGAALEISEVMVLFVGTIFTRILG